MTDFIFSFAFPPLLAHGGRISDIAAVRRGRGNRAK
jgi:hypothetical protein